MMAFVVYEAVWTLLYVVFIGVVVGELGGMFLGGIVMYCTLHYVEDISIIFPCSFAVGITQQYGIYVLLG